MVMKTIEVPGMTVEDALTELGTAMRELCELHARNFRGRSMRLTVRYVADVVREVLTLEYEPRRVSAVRVDEVLATAECVETYYLRLT